MFFNFRSLVFSRDAGAICLIDRRGRRPNRQKAGVKDGAFSQTDRKRDAQRWVSARPAFSARKALRFLKGALQIRNILTERRRQIDLMILLVDEDLSDMLGNCKFAESFALSHSLTVVSDCFVFILQIEAQHFARILRSLNDLCCHNWHFSEIVDLLGNNQGVLELFGSVDCELRGDIHELGSFEDLGVNYIADDGLVFTREIFVQQIGKSISGDCGLLLDWSQFAHLKAPFRRSPMQHRATVLWKTLSQHCERLQLVEVRTLRAHSRLRQSRNLLISSSVNAVLVSVLEP